MIAPAGDVLQLARELEAAYRAGVPARMQVPMRLAMADAVTCVAMPALAPELDLYVTKLATIAPAGEARPAITAVVVAFSSRTGALRAILDGAHVTSLKCAAVSALVTDRCAAPDARVLALAGTGAQARAQVRAVCAVRPITALRVSSGTPGRAAAFAAELRGELPDLDISAVPLADAVRGADVIATATLATTPLGAFADLAPHVHINCMGGHTPAARELPRELLQTSTLIVEHRPTAIAEAGPLHADALELADLLAAPDLRRTRTIFSSTGHAALDVLTTAHLLRELP